MKEIKLTQGRVATVSTEDYLWLRKFNWCLHNKGYAARNRMCEEAPGSQLVLMHREVYDYANGTKLASNVHVHHADGDKCNNVRSNLVAMPRRLHLAQGGSSNYIGVHWHKGTQLWVAKLYYNSKHHTLGYFTTEVAAAREVDRIALLMLGEGAVLNFPCERHTHPQQLMLPGLKDTTSIVEQE